MNKYAPHVYVVPEDDRDRQIADGFVLHHAVKTTRIQVMPVAGGWRNALKMLRDEYIPILGRYPLAHIVMLIDFDGQVSDRGAEFAAAVPSDLVDRVFVLGPKDNPEKLKRALNISFEEIGKTLADDCQAGTGNHWHHEELRHNDAQRQRLVQIVMPFLF